MIEKLTLQSIISKYYLNGIVESVKWVIKDNTLIIRFMSPAKDMLGEVKYHGFNLPNEELAIFNTSQLNKLIQVTSGVLLMNVEKSNKVATKLNIADSQFNLTYALAEALLISKVAQVEEPKTYAVEASLEEENLNALVKAKNALSDTAHLIVSNNIDLNTDPILEFTIGEEGDYSNKVTYSVPAVVNSNIKIPFNASYLKEILNANKGMDKGYIKISGDGLMKLHFTSEKMESTYFVVRKQEQ